jgi:chromosome partitioning protein
LLQIESFLFAIGRPCLFWQGILCAVFDMVRSIAAARAQCWFKPTPRGRFSEDSCGTLHDRKIAVAARMTIDEAGAYPIVRGWLMNTLVINNQKGGVGKTTLAVHLAWFMVEAGHRVLMIDVDAQGNATDTLNRYAGPATAADLFKPAAKVIAADDGGITLATADSSLTDVDRGSAGAVMTLQQNLAAAAEMFDVCVIDTPPSLGLRSVACLVAATHVLAPIYLEDYSVKGVKGLMQTVIGVQRRYGREDTKFLGLLPSNFNTKSPRQRTHLEQLLREAGKYVFPGQIVARDGYAEAVAERVPVWSLKRRSAQEAGREIRAVLAKIAERLD